VPGNESNGGEIRCKSEIAVSSLPRGEGESVDCVHVDVGGQNVTAAFDDAVGQIVSEKSSVDPLALEPTLHVRDREDDRVYIAAFDPGK
jgi:hypothetical protein